MKIERFRFALERLTSEEWARFERFASQYLLPDYPQLRTVAAPSGDLGRDSELFSPDGETTVLLQYSVTDDWRDKIRKTSKRVRDNFPNAAILIYVTNQQIGASADPLKKDIREKFKLVLDLHDRTWFTDRLNTSTDRQSAAEALAADVVDPYLAGRDVIESKAPALSQFESKAAVLYLQLQWYDDSREKGLTKVSFDALVKSVLRETSSEHRMTCEQVRAAVHKILPNHVREQVNHNVDAALERLDKRSVRRWRKQDEVCLTHEEVLRVRTGLADQEMKDESLMGEIEQALVDYFDEPISPDAMKSLKERTRRTLDTFLLSKGEEFAAAIAQQRSVSTKDDVLATLVANDFAEKPDSTRMGEKAVSAVRLALSEVLQRSSGTVQQYLREIADGYTLFGFLRAVPDVQKVMQHVFSNAEIWLDTLILLPVMAESLVEPNERVVSRLLIAAKDAGIKLKVTSGVVEEVERHINRCFTFLRTTTGWTGNVPFLYAMWSLSERAHGSFSAWAEEFCGKERPMDDIKDYLSDVWGVQVEDLVETASRLPEELRHEVDRIWREVHEARRRQMEENFVIDRLVKHDVECYLGVVGKRNDGGVDELGYVHWWLTFDRAARGIEQQLKEVLGADAPKSPVMSPDFLANYIAVGPMRSRVSKANEALLPVALFDLLPSDVPRELLDLAEGVRKDCGKLDERLLKRRLRDALDRLRQKPGAIARGGLTAIKENIERAMKQARA